MFARVFAAVALVVLVSLLGAAGRGNYYRPAPPAASRPSYNYYAPQYLVQKAMVQKIMPPDDVDPGVAAARRALTGTVVVTVAYHGRHGAPPDHKEGTGWICGPRHVLTARHLVAGSLETAAVLRNGTRLAARAVALDRAVDLALLAVAPEQPLAPLALAAKFEVGEAVLAVGHPRGHRWSVSRGIVSATGRSIVLPDGHARKNLVQTDAAVNPGSSGGPLVNLRGEVVGTVLIFHDGGQGLAWAVSAATARKFLAKHLKSGAPGLRVPPASAHKKGPR